ncbi:MAG: NAD-dependent epimerase/dehydratase family protein [Bacteroidetes bacterium]|nr:NAD-dependent epimerase/dehydratase family protein [Bacteroidota bacterium]
MKTALCLGAGGFIGSHMVKRLKAEGYWVRGVDLKYPEFSKTHADEFITGDLRQLGFTKSVMRNDGEYSFYPNAFGDDQPFDEIYQFAADMGGAGYVFTGEHDFEIMHNSAMINLNVTKYATSEKIFYSSSACMYPQELQTESKNFQTFELKESDAYPANPDSEYGWEKLFSERLYLSSKLDVRIARFHNIYGPEGTYTGGKEKAPAAMCRKVIEAKKEIEVWGTGEQTRSFLYIDDCIDAVRLLMESDFKEPLNIGSEEMVSINELAQIPINISGKDLKIKNIEGPIGVMGRNSDNTLIRKVLNWEPKIELKDGMYNLYKWIDGQP